MNLENLALMAEQCASAQVRAKNKIALYVRVIDSY